MFARELTAVAALAGLDGDYFSAVLSVKVWELTVSANPYLGIAVALGWMCVGLFTVGNACTAEQ